MIPLNAISFESPERGSGPTIFFSVQTEAIGFVCEFVSGQGVLWLTGPEEGEPSSLEAQRGFYVSVQLEADANSQLPGAIKLPNGSVLKSAASTAVKFLTAKGAPRYYTIAGTEFGEPTVFAAFSSWRAVVEANGSRHVLVEMGVEREPEEKAGS